MNINPQLGRELRQLRISKKMTLEELALKLQVHYTLLSKIEKGDRLPSGKLLQQLRKEFELSDEKYHYLKLMISSGEEVNYQDMQGEAQNQNKTLNLNVPQSLPILYSDSAIVTSNVHGVVLSFAQILGNTNNHNVVARIGISLQHAKSLLNALAKEVSNAEKILKKVAEDEKKAEN